MAEVSPAYFVALRMRNRTPDSGLATYPIQLEGAMAGEPPPAPPGRQHHARLGPWEDPLHLGDGRLRVMNSGCQVLVSMPPKGDEVLRQLVLERSPGMTDTEVD
jgi:hypothetical protein